MPSSLASASLASTALVAVSRVMAKDSMQVEMQPDLTRFAPSGWR